MRQGLKIVALWMLVAWPSMASGMATHMFMSKQAIGELAPGDLQSFLRDYERQFVFASVFPDSGYAEKDIIKLIGSFLPKWSINDIKKLIESLPYVGEPTIGGRRLSDDNFYGEISHWWPFLSAYGKLILERCPGDAAVVCPEIVAHWLGCAAHSLQDQYFDTYFVPQVADQYFSGDLSSAAATADAGIDMFLLADKKNIPLTGNLAGLIPFSFLGDLYRVMPGNFAVADLQRGVGLLSWVYATEIRIARLGSIKYMMRMPWVQRNYLTAKGGVNDTAGKTAAYVNSLWTQLKNRDSPLRDMRESLMVDSGR